jgi:hypothetical protein
MRSPPQGGEVPHKRGEVLQTSLAGVVESGDDDGSGVLSSKHLSIVTVGPATVLRC